MRRTGSLVAAVSLAAAMTAGPVSAATTTYRADLTAEEEVPTKGPAGGRGTAEVVLNPDAGEVCYTLTYSGISKPTAAHIHDGVKGKAGPVFVDFQYTTNGDKACVPADANKLRAIGENPAGYYVNVHTAEYPNGAIRGQLGPA
jgi:CHRD domain